MQVANLPTPSADGPRWSSVVRRQVLDSPTGEVILDEDVRDMTDKTKAHAKVEGGPKDVIVRLWYRDDGRKRPSPVAAAAIGNDRDEWSMPVLRDAPDQQHRERLVSPHNFLLIAKQLTRK